MMKEGQAPEDSWPSSSGRVFGLPPKEEQNIAWIVLYEHDTNNYLGLPNRLTFV